MKLFQMIQEHLFSENEVEIDDSWGEDIANLYNEELADNIENWEIHIDKDGEKIAHLIK